jgi:hypothetical protein
VIDHDQHCFIAVPYGKNDAEHLRIEGWVNEVMVPVVRDHQLTPFIAVAQMSPSAITLEIRTHLAFDKIAFFDLGGIEASEPPNPNVMYEVWRLRNGNRVQSCELRNAERAGAGWCAIDRRAVGGVGAETAGLFARVGSSLRRDRIPADPHQA